MPRTAKEVRAAAVESRDAMQAYDSWSNVGAGDPPEEVTQRMMQACEAFRTLTGLADEVDLVELLLEILPEPQVEPDPRHLGPGES